MKRIFILSPAKTSGERARLLHNPLATFDLARRLRAKKGVPVGEVFSFLSGLYFRGKLTYANTFASPPPGVPGVLVVTSNRGLLTTETLVNLDALGSFSEVPIDPSDPRYLGPLQRDSRALTRAIGPDCQVIFLGSIGTPRYVEPLLEVFGTRLLFPPAFVGRGDMSRGGLLLRAVAEKVELPYGPLAGAIRRGKRPEKLSPRTWGYRILDGRTRMD